ncbi:MAG: sugar transferase [Blastochloris sp.]|nr:sugar transferase [Blastochloris sp.]
MSTGSGQARWGYANPGFKQALDRVFAAFGLLCLSPLLAVIALRVKRSDGGPILYRARRVGQYGRPFALFKFRSMYVDADRRGPGITTQGDPRVTPIGRWLRRTKADELPQLFNVLIGDMHLVGPRPEDPRYVALYTPEQRRVLDVRPGITSAASLAYRHEEELLSGDDWETTYRTEVMPAKLAIDLEYLRARVSGKILCWCCARSARCRVSSCVCAGCAPGRWLSFTTLFFIRCVAGGTVAACAR